MRVKEEASGACDKGAFEEDDGPLLEQLSFEDTKNHPGPGTDPDRTKNAMNKFEDFYDHDSFLPVSVAGPTR